MPGSSARQRTQHPFPGPGTPIVVEVVGEEHSLVSGESAEREAGLFGRHG